MRSILLYLLITCSFFLSDALAQATAPDTATINEAISGYYVTQIRKACVGVTYTVRCTYPGVDPNNYYQIRVQPDCSIRATFSETNGSLRWEGENMEVIKSGIDANGYPYAEIRFTKTGSFKYSVKWMKFDDVIGWSEYLCGRPPTPYTWKDFIYNYTCEVLDEVVVEDIPADKPDIALKVVKHPSFPDSKTLQLSVVGGESSELKWLQGGDHGRTFVLDDPYDCIDYQVAFVNGCGMKEGNVVNPSQHFNATNMGFSRAFENHILKELRSAESRSTSNTSEKSFRIQYDCIFNHTWYQPWAQRFVKFNFDYVANHSQCKRSFEYDTDTQMPYTLGFPWLATYYLRHEVGPAIATYAPSTKTCTDLLTWHDDHEEFLNKAMLVCFDEMLLSYPLDNWQKSISIYANRATLPNIRIVRDFYIALQRQKLGCSGQETNPTWSRPPQKSDLYSTSLDELSSLKVSAVIDTLFFLKAKSSIQLRVTKTSPDGTVIDLTSSIHGTKYSTSLDTSLVEISSEGLLTIKRTDLAYVYNRLPFMVKADHESDMGVGQFAIFDNDADNDYLADSYEQSIGLSPFNSNINIDTDGDGISDVDEAFIRTSPVKIDSDGDGFSDFLEQKKGSDATNLLSVPNFIYSVANGQWNNPASWSCNCLPTKDDSVIISSDTVIEITPTIGVQECLNLVIQSNAVLKNSGALKIYYGL